MVGLADLGGLFQFKGFCHSTKIHGGLLCPRVQLGVVCAPENTEFPLWNWGFA